MKALCRALSIAHFLPRTGLDGRVPRRVAALVALAASVGCGGLVDPSGPGPEEPSVPNVTAELPKKPMAPPTTVTTRRYFAVRKLLLGDRYRDGSIDPGRQAWRSYGTNIDGLVSTKTSATHCTLAPGAIGRVREDGADGIDNGFGFALLPILIATDPDLPRLNEMALEAGGETLILEVVGLAAASSQTNTGLGGQLLFSTSTKNAPKWDGSDVRAIATDSLKDGTIEGGSKTPFTDAYVSSGTFVATAPRAIVHFRFGGGRMPIALSNATISFKSSPLASDTLQGTISGVMPFTTYEAELRRHAGSFYKELCSASKIDWVIEQTGHARDILSDGTNRGGVACDAISAGFGFEAKEIAAPTRVGAVSPPDVDLCESR